MPPLPLNFANSIAIFSISGNTEKIQKKPKGVDVPKYAA
jgi:hypothetical protein